MSVLMLWLLPCEAVSLLVLGRQKVDTIGAVLRLAAGARFESEGVLRARLLSRRLQRLQ